MEISDYLSILGRRVRLLLILPLLAMGLVMIAVLATNPQRFATNATVALSSLSPAMGSQFSGAQGNRVLLETFRAAAVNPTVLSRVADKTGVDLPTLQDRGAVTASPVGDSSLVRVTARLPKSEDSAKVARAVAGETIKFLLEPQVQLAGKLEEEAQKTVTQTEGELAELARSSGLALGVADFEIRSRSVSTLRDDISRARAAGDTRLAANLEAALKTQSAELSALAPKLAQFQRLTELNKQALTRVNDARASREQARALQAAADSGSFVTMTLPQKPAIGPLLVRRGLGGLFAGLFVAALSIVLLEFLGENPLLRRRSRRTAPLVEEPEPS